MKTRFTIIVFLFFALICLSAQSKESSVQYSLPDFVLNPPMSHDTFYGLGYSNAQNPEEAKTMALLNARRDIESQVVNHSLVSNFQLIAEDDASTTAYQTDYESSWEELGHSKFYYEVEVDWNNKTLEVAILNNLPDSSLLTYLSIEDTDGSLSFDYKPSIIPTALLSRAEVRFEEDNRGGLWVLLSLPVDEVMEKAEFKVGEIIYNSHQETIQSRKLLGE